MKIKVEPFLLKSFDGTLECNNIYVKCLHAQFSSRAVPI